MYTLLYAALKNTGDFLIYERTKSLLRKYKGMGDYLEFHSRRESLDTHLDQVNSTKAVIICGGPGTMWNMYPGTYPLATNLDDIKVPIIIMGSGWYGVPGDDATVAEYRFSDSTIQFFHRIKRGGYNIGVRDYLTERALRNNGITNVLMIGCPAWYDLEYLDLDFCAPKSMRTVVFTAPAKRIYCRQAVEIMAMLKRIFPETRLICSFHRGLTPDEYTLEADARWLGELARAATGLGFEVIDTSYGTEKIALYPECDLHVGYRVHGHIYFLSQRKPSFLVHEDGRGRGASEALGVPGVQGWSRTALGRVAAIIKRRRLSGFLEKHGIQMNPNRSAATQLERYITEELSNGFARFQTISQTMRQHHRKMIEFIDAIP
jgi:hypothetical protein